MCLVVPERIHRRKGCTEARLREGWADRSQSRQQRSPCGLSTSNGKQAPWGFVVRKRSKSTRLCFCLCSLSHFAVLKILLLVPIYKALLIITGS